MHVQIQKADKLSSGNADNASASCTLVPGTGKAIRLTTAHFGFTGVAATANALATISDSITTLRFAVAPGTPLDVEPISPLAFAAGQTVTVTLAAGGAAGSIGNVSAAGYEVDPTKGE